MNPEIDVLVVDDNASIRELLFQALSPMVKVRTFGSPLEALRQVQTQAPDLVVCDYRMPELSGVDLLGKLAGCLSRATVVMMASRADISGPLAGSNPLVEEFIEKPFFIDEATARIKRVLERVELGKATREAADSTSVRGTLAQMSVVDLLQTLDIGRKSCSLVVTRNGRRAEMQFHDGQLVHATLSTGTGNTGTGNTGTGGTATGGSLSGEAAVYEVVSWNDGAFLIDFERRECPRTITHSTQSVLLEALRIFDETQREGEAPEGASGPGCGSAFASAPSASPAHAVGF
jgi:FixJ family two-component response regulator